MNEKLVNKFGYSEMYEWIVYPGDEHRFGRFVQFNDIEPNKINLAYDPQRRIIGVSSVNNVVSSDNPTEWTNKYLSNEYGDIYMTKERLAVGQKDYDQLEEFSYIRTFPYEQYIPVESDLFDKNIKYAKRSERLEWVGVIMLGKAIVRDDGKCVPGQYCRPQFSEINEDAGIAVPADRIDDNSFYVIDRFSENTIVILVK